MASYALLISHLDREKHYATLWSSPVNDRAEAIYFLGWHPPYELDQRTKGDSLSKMNQRLAFGLTIRKSRIHGKGCFAAILFRQNQQNRRVRG